MNYVSRVVGRMAKAVAPTIGVAALAVLPYATDAEAWHRHHTSISVSACFPGPCGFGVPFGFVSPLVVQQPVFIQPSPIVTGYAVGVQQPLAYQTPTAPPAAPQPQITPVQYPSVSELMGMAEKKGRAEAERDIYKPFFDRAMAQPQPGTIQTVPFTPSSEPSKPPAPEKLAYQFGYWDKMDYSQVLPELISLSNFVFAQLAEKERRGYHAYAVGPKLVVRDVNNLVYFSEDFSGLKGTCPDPEKVVARLKGKLKEIDIDPDKYVRVAYRNYSACAK